MSSKNHIEESIAKIRSLFEKASERIDSLKSGEKVTATKLAEELSNQFGMTSQQIYPILLFLIKNYPCVDVVRGAHGGIIKY